MNSTFLVMVLTTMSASFDDPPQLPDGYWPESKVAEVLAKTKTIRLAPDLTSLAPGERAAVGHLIKAGALFQKMYEDMRHHQALTSYKDLVELDERHRHAKRTQDLLTLYRVFRGPIATTLENKREPFLPVDPQSPARNVYPLGVTREEIDVFLNKYPEKRPAIVSERSVVRRATNENIARDLATLDDAVLGLLHADVKRELESLANKPNPAVFYAVPYSVAYAAETKAAYGELMLAANEAEESDTEFARYLRNRARDLLSNDYESGDASWVTGRFQRLNAQIGTYETYDDALYGVRAFPALNVLLRDQAASDDLRSKLKGLQSIQDALPGNPQEGRRIKEDISVGIYDVIADFGQSRGTNTATILPNDALFSRRYGRTILLRRNIMEDSTLFDNDLRTWKAATHEKHADDFKASGEFQRTLWHEVGHYLGVDRDKQGRSLDEALEDYADALEEMKSDLVSLFALHRMAREGSIDAELLKAAQAGGIWRTLLVVKPLKDQPYQTMQLAQFNYFVDKGLLEVEPESARLSVRYDRYESVISSLLREVLGLQHEGDRAAAERFFETWGAWTAELHEKLAARIRSAEGARYFLVRYAALGE